MLVRMWGEDNLYLLLVGMQTGPTTMEINKEIPQKIESRATK